MNLSSANAFNLNKTKNLLSGKESNCEVKDWKATRNTNGSDGHRR